MPLQLNLLHEQIAEKRQRQRDPLKLSMYAAVAIGVVMVGFYMIRGYQTLEVKHRLADVQRQWSQVEPKVTAAQKRSTELTSIIGTTKVLDQIIEGRFYWGPILQRVSRCVAPNVQLTAIDGVVSDDNHTVTLTVEGTAAGREPRAAAEELRQLLNEQFAQDYTAVKVEFRVLEDLDTIVKVSGANMAMAHFTLTATFSQAGAAPTPTPAPRTKR